MIANYHTHTRWCRHATGEIEDYIREAVRKGLRAVAITEHVPHSQNFDPRRMQWEEFSAYNAELDRLIEQYRDQIHVIKGFECEYYPFALENYKMFRDRYGYKLLILGHHTNKDRTADNFAPKGEAEMQQYADEVIEGLRTGLFTFLAHPDVPFCGYTGSAEFALEHLCRLRRVGNPGGDQCQRVPGRPCLSRPPGLGTLPAVPAHLAHQLGCPLGGASLR